MHRTLAISSLLAASACAAFASDGAPLLPEIRPSETFLEYRDREFRISYPGNWHAFGDRDSVGVTIAPPDAVRGLPRGGTSVGYGAVVSFFYTEDRPAKLDKGTRELTEGLQASNPGIRPRSKRSQKVKIDGQNALVTILEGPSPFNGHSEVDRLVTVAWKQGLFYIIFISPEKELPVLGPIFDKMLASLSLSR